MGLGARAADTYCVENRQTDRHPWGRAVAAGTKMMRVLSAPGDQESFRGRLLLRARCGGGETQGGDAVLPRSPHWVLREGGGRDRAARSSLAPA